MIFTAAPTNSSATTSSTPTAFSTTPANPVLPSVPTLRYNDFGGTIGGPVWIPKIYEQRNKTFFFVSEEARRIVTYTNPTASVPYAGMANGQFDHVVCTQWANSNGAPGRLYRLRHQHSYRLRSTQSRRLT